MYGDYTEFPVAQLVKNLPAMQESLVLLLGWEDSLKNRLHTPSFLGFPGGSDSKESTCNMGNLSFIPGLGRYHGEKNGYPLQNCCLENPHGQRNLVGYSPWDTKIGTQLSNFHFLSLMVIVYALHVLNMLFL